VLANASWYPLFDARLVVCVTVMTDVAGSLRPELRVQMVCAAPPFVIAMLNISVGVAALVTRLLVELISNELVATVFDEGLQIGRAHV
jgi:hypothetical protein